MRLQAARWPALVTAAVAVVLAVLSGRDALAFATQGTDPQTALRIDPDNPVALVEDAQTRAGIGDRTMTAGALADIARRSIAELPLNSAAFRLFGVAQASDSNLDRLGDQMAMANRLSRRDAATQIFLIEDGVRRNNVADTLRAYDTALRVDRSSRALLYPVLTEALSEPLVRQRLAPYLKAGPPWLESFLRYAVSNARDPRSVAELAFLAGGFPEGRAYESLDTELLSVLVERGAGVTAARYYRSLDNADAKVIESLAMTAATAEPAYAPITWQPYSLQGIDAAWVASTGGAVELEAALDPGYIGPVARKIVTLRPGAYRVVSSFENDREALQGAISWSIACAQGGSLLNAETSLVAKGTIGGRFTVPAGCPVQSVTFSVRTDPGAGSGLLRVGSPKLQSGGS